jgi:tripartite-type tricarboxylate transporter receptor subunit TctC
MKAIAVALIIAAATLFRPDLAPAETYPSHQIRIIVTFAPGGNADVLARLLGEKLSTALGQPVIIENKPGGATVVGTNSVVQAPSDGYTLLEASTSLSTNPGLGNATSYDADMDLEPVITLVTIPAVIVINKSIPATTFAEFIAYAKANPGAINYGTAGMGSFPHLAMEQLVQEVGVRMTHVPFRGFGPAMLGLLRNDVQVVASDIPGALQHIQAGELRALAVTSKTRMSMLPEVPTASEAGARDYEALGFLGIMVRASTPPEIVQTLNREINKVLQSPEIASYIDKNGLIKAGGTSADFATFLRKDKLHWSKVIETGNIRAQ